MSGKPDKEQIKQELKKFMAQAKPEELQGFVEELLTLKPELASYIKEELEKQEN